LIPVRVCAEIVGAFRRERRATVVDDDGVDRVDLTVRDSWYVEPNPDHEMLVCSLLRGLVPLVEHEFRRSVVAPEEVDFLRYRKGGHFQVHVDGGYAPDPESPVARRVVSAVVCLDAPGSFSGGDFVIRNGDEIVPVWLGTGIVVLFDALTPHGVLPVKSGVRHSAVGWFTAANRSPLA
jgi:hypothetical protein